MNRTNQLIGAYCGYAIVVILLVGWWGIAGFVPPPSSADGPQQIAARFAGNIVGVRVGLLMSLFGAALLMPWYSTLTVQVKRIEGKYSAFAYVQAIAGAAVTVEFILPLWRWATAAFRPDSSPEIIQRLNDAAWLPFLGAMSTTVVQAVAPGVVVLQDKRAKLVFPRWFGYFNFWAAAVFIPGGLILFFHSGPFAWNGIVSFWLVFAMFGVDGGPDVPDGQGGSRTDRG